MFNESPAVADHFPVPRDRLQQEPVRNMPIGGSALPKKPLRALTHRLNGTQLACSARPVRRNLLREQRQQRSAEDSDAQDAQKAAAMPSAYFRKF